MTTAENSKLRMRPARMLTNENSRALKCYWMARTAWLHQEAANRVWATHWRKFCRKTEIIEDAGLLVIRSAEYHIDEEAHCNSWRSLPVSISPGSPAHRKAGNAAGQKLGIEQNGLMAGGLRTAETLKIVTMVYTGFINKHSSWRSCRRCSAMPSSSTGADGDADPTI